jgi:serine/threonine-protein phosphatase 2A regulatory subunit A
MSTEQISSKTIIDDLISREPKRQCKAIKNINKLQSEIQPDKFRKEFLPFFLKCVNEEEDDVLEEICKVYRDIFALVGGKKYLKDLFPLIELVLHTGDKNIRKEIITIFRHLIDKQDEFSDIEKDLLETIQNLANSEDPQHEIGFIAFSSEFFGDFKEKYRNQIYSIFKQFTEKKSQGKLIKIELSANLSKLSKHLGKNDFIELFNILMKESCDAVRFNLVQAIGNLKDKSKLDGYENFIGENITKFSEDESWRVRLMLAKNIEGILELINLIQKNYPEIKTIILKAFLKLLQDNEGEVRSMACSKLDDVGEALCKEDNFDKILSCLKNLKSDSLNYVRSSLASNVLSLAPIIGAKKTNEYIFPVFQELIKDEDHDIRMVIIKNLDKLNEVVNIDNFVQGIIPSLIEISDNNNWRVRNQVQEIVPVFARIVNKKLFLESIMPICIKWLTDPVYAIRQNACKIMKRLYDIFKGEDFEKKLLSKISPMSKSESYLIRITVVMLIREFLVDEFELDFLEKKLFPYIVKLSDDKIPNVRQACSVVIKKLMRLSKNKDVVKECKSIVEELKRDKDLEVVYAITEN